LAELRQTPTRIESVRPIGGRQTRLVLAAPDVARTHTVPGQYAMLTLDGTHAKPFAIASPPGAGDHVEFLVKTPIDKLELMQALTPGAHVPASEAMGRGYPVEKAHGKHLWLFGVGSGVAPLRSVVETIARSRKSFGDVTLVYGVRHEDELTFEERFDDWRNAGIELRLVVSQPRAPWSGATGYVQQHVPDAFPQPEDVVAFVCGMPAMDRDVAAALAARGVSAAQTFRNW
jgi:NAD(P)H-flavin reductase